MNNHITEMEKNQSTLNDFLGKSERKAADINKLVEYGNGIMSDSRINAALGCGKFLTFLHSRDMQKSKLETGYFCKNRLCPGCAWRKSAHDAVKISCIMQAAAEQGYRLVFATLTAENVPADELSAAVERYDKAYTEMMRRGKFRYIIGAIRKLEITYNSTTNTYHPHIHSVWFMPRGWRKSSHPAHITKTELRNAWEAALGSKYAVSAAAQDIRDVKSATRENIAEFAKYPAKSCDYLQSRETFQAFYYALRGTRLITFMRLARKLAAAYKSGELNCYAETDDTEYYYRTFWRWNREESRMVLDDMEELEQPIRFDIIDTDETMEE